MLRAFAILLLTASSALAWEARSGDVCELTHEGEAAQVRVTYDHGRSGVIAMAYSGIAGS